MKNEIRRGVLLQNHFPAIRLIANKAWPTMPQEVKAYTSVDDLFQDCIVELRTKLSNYDACRSRPVTFIYLVLNSFISKQRELYVRKKRRVNTVSLDDAGELAAKKISNVDTDEAERLFLEVYHTLSIRLQGKVRQWFFSEVTKVCRSANTQSLVVFRRIAKQHGLTERHCLAVMSDVGVQLRIRRKICTLVRRYEYDETG